MHSAQIVTTKMDRQKNWRDDRMSDCRSFGSNYNPCSQSRKISIGVVDSFSKTRAQNVEKDVTVAPTAEILTSSKGNSMKGGTSPTIGKLTEDPEQETSPWVSTRSFHQELPSSKAVDNAKQASILPVTSNMLNKSNGIKKAAATHSVQFFEKHMSILQSGDGKQKKFNSVTYRRKGWKDVSAPRVEEFSFATAQEVHVTEKDVIENKTNKAENMGNETLRVKLWEILGAVSSPNKQSPNSQDLEIGTNNLKPERKSDAKGKPVVKAKQNDTIESDSESPNHTIRRLVTRSLTQKRPPTKLQPIKIKKVASSIHKKKHLEKNIFSFEEGVSGRLCGGSGAGATDGGSSMSKRKISERKSSTIEPHKMCFHERENADDTQQESERGKTKTTSEKSSLHGNRIGSLKSFLPKKNSELVEPENGIQEKDSHPSPVMEMTDQLGDGPTLQKNVDQQEELVNPSLKNIVDPQYDLESPTFEMNIPIKSSSPCSPPISNQGQLDDCSPAERVFHMGGIRSFKNVLTSSPEYYKTNRQMESSDDAGEPEESPLVKSVPTMKEWRTEIRLSQSSSEESDSESSEDCSHTEGQREMESLFPEVGTAEKPKFVRHPVKRHRTQDDVEVIRLSPTSGSLKGTEGRFILHGPSELNQEDGLASAVALFALALERVKSKMNSMTSKKSAEILMSVADEIHSQLQNAESHIQTDMGKLTSLGKSKRKRMETRFQEQQEQLKAIHERFKEEVSQHLQDCRSTLEGLEAHQIEFKGAVEKQKASHRKLLLQAEEAVENQLNDAQRKITSVRKVAREKMVQLKYVVSECLKEGILS